MNKFFSQHLAGVLLIAATIIVSLASCSKETIAPELPIEDTCNCGTIYGYYFSCTINWIVVENECTSVRDTIQLEETPDFGLFDTYCE